MLMVAVLSIVAKVLAIGRQMVLTSAYGASVTSDAYVLAQSIPNTVFNLVGMALGVSFTPTFQKIFAQNGKDEADRFTSNTVNILLVLITCVVAVLFLFARQVIQLFAGGASNEMIELAASFLRISAFSLYFVGMNNVFQSYLKIKGRFFAVSVLGVPLSIIEIISVWVAVKTNDHMLAVGIVLACFAQWLVLTVDLRKTGYRHQAVLDWRSEHIRHILLLAVPILIGVCIDEVNVIIDKRIASGFDSGSISLLTYTHTLISIVHTVITVSINTVMYPQLAADAAAGNQMAVKSTLQSALNKSLLFTIPAMVGTIVFADPILQLLFMRGQFTYEDVQVAAPILQMYAICLIANGMRTLLQSYFYSYGRTKTSMYASIVGVAVNIVLNFVLSYFMGVKGLALATSISIAVTALILCLIMTRERAGIADRTFVLRTVKCCCAALIMGAVGYGMIYGCQVLSYPVQIMVIPMVAICVVVYFALAVAMKVLPLQELKRMLKR